MFKQCKCRFVLVLNTGTSVDIVYTITVHAGNIIDTFEKQLNHSNLMMAAD